MKPINFDTIELVYDALEALAVQHTPKSSSTLATKQQWLHAIATDSRLFFDWKICNESELRAKVVEELSSIHSNCSHNKLREFIMGSVKFPPKKNSTFRFIDLFAGIGGTRLGAQNNSGTCVFTSEFDSFAQKTYQHNFGELPFGDITDIDAKSIPDHDLLLAGFPCQPFSYSGRCEGFEDKTRGTLFFDVLRILEEKRPKAVLLENVKGFKSHDKGQTLHIALNALKEAGYRPFWHILNSYDFGVPQYRERWYCVAVRQDIQTFNFPEGEGRNTKLKDIVDTENRDPRLQLNDFERERIKFHFANVSENPRVKHDNSMYEPNTKKGKHGVYSFQKPDGALRFHVGDHAKTQIQEAFYSCLDTYAPTIIANRVPKLWDIGRKLSVEESLKLQGFPKAFEFPVSMGQSYKQLGNSVTVPVIDAIIKRMLEAGAL